jgi:hypothetical protein
MKIDWNIKPYVIRIKQSQSEIDQTMQKFEGKITEEQAVQILEAFQEEEVQCGVSENETVVFSTKEKVKDYLSVIRGFGFQVVAEDATDDLFYGNLNTVEAGDDFKNMTKDYVVKNFSVDDVLDKILQRGVESISESDRLILEGIK